MKNSIKSLKNYFQLIMMTVTCLIMGFIKDKRKNHVYGNDTALHRGRRVGILSKIWKSFSMDLVCETPKAKLISKYIVKDTDSKNKKNRPVLQPSENKEARKNKIIYWNEPRIQNKISKAVYFNTG